MGVVCCKTFRRPLHILQAEERDYNTANGLIGKELTASSMGMATVVAEIMKMIARALERELKAFMLSVRERCESEVNG